MNTLVIVIAVLVAVIALSICCFLYIKKKIRNKIIDITADIVTETAEKYLDEQTSSKINRAASITAETLKEGKTIKSVAKKGLEIAMQKLILG